MTINGKEIVEWVVEKSLEMIAGKLKWYMIHLAKPLGNDIFIDETLGIIRATKEEADKICENITNYGDGEVYHTEIEI